MNEIEPIAITESSLSNDKAAIEALMNEVPEPVSDTPDLQESTKTNTPPPEAPPAEAPIVEKPAPVDRPSSDEELEKKLEEFKAKTPNQEAGFKELKEVVRAERRANKELAEKLKELEKNQQSVKALTPDIEKELDELRMQAKAIDPTKDKEFQEKYINSLKNNDEKVLNILVNNKLKEPIAAMIREIGGVSAAARSEEMVPEELGGDTTWAEWIENTLLPKVPLLERKRIETILGQSIELAEKMQDESQYYKTHAKEVLEAKEKASSELFSQGVQEAVQQLGGVAQKWEYPSDATPEQKAMTDKHNARYAKVENKFKEISDGLHDPKKSGQTAVLAATSVYLMEANQDLQSMLDKATAEVKDLTERMDKIKVSGTTARSGQPAAPAKGNSTKMMDTKTALKTYLDEI